MTELAPGHRPSLTVSILGRMSDRDSTHAADGAQGRPVDRPAADPAWPVHRYDDGDVEPDDGAGDADDIETAGRDGQDNAGRDTEDGGGPDGPGTAARRPRWRAATVVAVAAVLVAAAVLWTAHRRAAPASPPVALSPALPPHTTIGQVLHSRGAALLRGDETGWLRDVDPARPQLLAQLRTRYQTLRALQVSGWRETVLDPGEDAPLPATTVVRVSVAYCLARPRCVLDGGPGTPSVAENIGFTSHDGRVWLTDLLAPQVDRFKQVPVPWQTGPLQARTGSRVIVAAPPELTGRLDDTLARAEQAARVADQYARYVKAPDHYLVYVAGPSQWKQWFGSRPPGPDPLAYAVHLSRLDMQVVVDAGHVRPDMMQLVLQHEFGHVVTLNDAEPRYDFFDIDAWLAEGVAEYIAWAGRSPADYYRLGDVRRYLRAGWNGQLRTLMPQYDSLAASAVYGISYLALRYLADHYGEPAMLAFVNAVRRQNLPVEGSAQYRFGKPWATINKECADYVRATVR